MTTKHRLAQLEKTQGASTNTMRLALMKPSGILQRAKELIQQGAQPTDEQRARIAALEAMQ